MSGVKFIAKRGYDWNKFGVELFTKSSKHKIKINGQTHTSIKIDRSLFEEIKKCFDDIDNGISN